MPSRQGARDPDFGNSCMDRRMYPAAKSSSGRSATSGSSFTGTHTS